MARRTMWAVLLALGLAIGCARRAPQIAVGPLADGLEAALATRPLATGQNIRADELARTQGASYHLVQVRGAETPHVHATHDLTVLVLRGRGTLALGDDRLRLGPGDAAVVPRSTVHWFTNEGSVAAVAFVIFTPPLDAPDSVPAPVD